MKVLKAVMFIVAWVASCLTAIYLFAGITGLGQLSVLDWVMYSCCFIVTFLHLFFNHMK